ncbi:MAG: hypothetical protein ACOCXG_01935 [Nanoarchaeota archaeon]
MRKQELLNIIEFGEGQHLEFKESLTKEIKKEICAFANAENRVLKRIKLNEPITEPINERKNKVYNYIKNNPGCKRDNLVVNLRISMGSLKRELAILVSENKIEMKGSKKIGGYYVK